MTTLNLRLPRPHPGQREVLRDARRFNVVACGRRWGKSTMGLHRMVPPMLEGYPVGWFAPTYKYLAEVWRDFLRVLAPVTARANGTERRIELITGGSIEFWTLDDPDAGRSRRYKRVAIDEAAKAKNLEVAWTEAIRATLADYRGDADFYSTPKGRDFFWRCFTKGTDPGEPDWASWQKPTSDNPFIPPDEVEDARRQLPERVFDQEFLAAFNEDGGGVFRGVTGAVDHGRSDPVPPVPGNTYSVGVDIARVNDFTVISALDAQRRQVYHERFNQINWERQLAAVRAVHAKYPGVVVLDSTGMGGDMFHQALHKAGVRVVPYTFTNQSKEALIDRLALDIERGHLRLMDVPEQTNELLAFEYELTPSRNVRMNAPEGMHDDCVIALGLSNWGVERFAAAPETPLETLAREEIESAARAREQDAWLDPMNDDLYGV